MIRQPIVVLVGHIDHGKSSILERIKGISITKSEAGGITQTIQSYNIDIKHIKNVCGKLLESAKVKLTIPGLLFLDSPGHAAFNNMRKRGGNLADIAILVIDIMEGLKEQTIECIKILQQYKTPFIIALNKIDNVKGYRPNVSPSLLQNIKNQNDFVQQEIDTKLYELVGSLAEHGFNAERFDRLDDYTKQVAIIPVSAKHGEGLPELLMVLTGLAQRYLEKSLQIEVQGPGKGIILEIKEETGLGKALDVILHDGTLKVNDRIVIGSLHEPIVTKIRGMFHIDKGKFKAIKEAHAADGVKISAPNIDEAYGGMPILVANENLEQAKERIQQEIEEVLIETDTEGVIIKADTLGSLEALTGLLREQKINIQRASLGDITKKDLAEAATAKDPTHKVILGFNVKETEQHQDVMVINHDVIYKTIEEYEQWKQETLQSLEAHKIKEMPKPCKMKIMRGCVFRQSNPAVFGVHVMGGNLTTDANLIKADGSKLAPVKEIQLDGKNVSLAERNAEIAISVPGIIVGRHVKEGDVLFTDLTEDEFRKLKELKKYLKEDEIEVLKELSTIKRRDTPMWGI